MENFPDPDSIETTTNKRKSQRRKWISRLHPRDNASAAVLGASAVLLGALLGIAGAWGAATIQIKASREQSQTEFLREQRIVTYVRFLDSVNELSDKEDHMLDAIDAYLADDERLASSVQTELADVKLHLSSMLALENQIQVVGSKQVRLATDDLMKSHYALVDRWGRIIEAPATAIQEAGVSFYDERLHLKIAAQDAAESMESLTELFSASELEKTGGEYDEFIGTVRNELAIPD